MKNTLTTVMLVIALGLVASAQKFAVVATNPDLADLVERIGGDLVEVECLTRGSEDLHKVTIRPSMLARLRSCQMLVEMGLDMEHGWLPPLLKSARNDKIAPGSTGFINASSAITIRKSEVVGKGEHNHPLGNPHFNLDPLAMRRVAALIAEGLVSALPEKSVEIRARLAAFEAELDEHMVKWRKSLAPLKGARFIEYHETWGYFADRFELEIFGRLEPKPGLPPTASHLAELTGRAREAKVRMIVGRPPYRADLDKAAEMVSGHAFAVDPMSRRGEKGGYLGFMDRLVEEFATKLEKPKTGP